MLPTLLETFCAVVALSLRQLFLAARQLVELPESVVDILGPLVGRGSSLLGLVLVLFSVELEIEKAREVASGAAATAPASTRAKRHFDLAERGFGPQQVLQRLLFVRNGVLPLLLLEFLRGRAHRVGGSGHLFLKRAELAILSGELARLEPARERKRLVAQRGLSV